jgi:hypothetical protein
MEMYVREISVCQSEISEDLKVSLESQGISYLLSFVQLALNLRGFDLLFRPAGLCVPSFLEHALRVITAQSQVNSLIR